MTLTNNLRTQVDLPIYEWCKFAMTLNGFVMCTSDDLSGRYIYLFASLISIQFYCYDTWSDSWQQLSIPSGVAIPTTLVSMSYDPYSGYQGRIISATSTTFTTAGFAGNILGGYTIKITGGTGAGQERTITSVADPVVADRGFMTTATASSGSFTDSAKAWGVNQWVGYQFHVINNAGRNTIRKVAYNNSNTLVFADTNNLAYENFTTSFATIPTAFVVTPANVASYYTIESSVFTINTPWTTTPDNTSKFTIYSGGIWLVANTASAYSIQYYDVAADVWYMKTSPTGILSATAVVTALSTDVAIKHISKSAGNFLSSTATSGGNFTLTDSVQTLTTNRYANYLIEITGGTGIGQTRTILAHSATVFTVVRQWDVNPDNTSTYKIYGDYDKIYMVGNGLPSIYQYSIEADFLTTGRIYDWGTARSGAVVWGGVNQQAIALTSITVVSTTALVTTPINHNLQIGQTVTITGDTSANASKNNITATILTSGTQAFSYAVAAGGSATFTSHSSTVLVDSTKNWATNSLIGMCVAITTTNADLLTGSIGTYGPVQITANTATTITYNSIGIQSPSNGTSRYIIFDPKSFGTDVGQGAQSQTTNGYGTASSGSTTTLVDSSKLWATNQWSNRELWVYFGTGAGTFITISSNTATTLTYSTQSFTPDATTQYKITDGFGYATSGGSNTLTDSSQNWVTNQWANSYVKIVAGTGSLTETAIISNTSTQLTVNVSPTPITPDSTTVYSILAVPPRGTGNTLSWAWGTTDSTTNGNYLISICGGGSSEIDSYDITTEQWCILLVTPNFETFTIGTMCCYDGGNRIYFTKDNTLRVYYYDIINGIIVPSSTIPYNATTASVGNAMELIQTVDGLQYIYFIRKTSNEFFRVPISW